MVNPPTCLRLAIALALAASPLLSAPASATAAPSSAASSAVSTKHSHGGCAHGSSRWRLKAKKAHGRIKVTGTIISRSGGQTWNWKLRHNGSVSDHGTASTKKAQKKVKVVRSFVDLSGDDVVQFRAWNAGSDEVCRSELTI